jgi:lipid II:glycine glycyltransferase (peptidoglycan interpeptide bridge formation enzyme)
VKVKILDIEKDRGRYETLCQKQNASVFNSWSWLMMYKDHLRLYGLFNNNEELTGAFFLYHTSKKTFRLDICPPFSAHNGLFFENRSENNSNIQTTVKHVLETIAAFLGELNSHLLVFTLPAAISDAQPFIWKKFDVKVKYTYHLDLGLPVDTLLANLSSEKRKSLNKAQKDGLEIKRETDMKVVKDLILKTFSRKQVMKNLAYLDKILFEFASADNSIAFVAYEKGQAIAATFCVHDSVTAFYLFGGYDAGQSHHGAGVSCMWNSILKAKELGLKTFDFEGSMLPEVEKYFREFGGTLTPYYSVYRATTVMNMLLKMKEVAL